MVFNNVYVYKDFNFKERYAMTYPIEVIGDKARIINNTGFGEKKKSRLNKLTCIGKISDPWLYQLNVFGNFVYIKLKYRLP